MIFKKNPWLFFYTTMVLAMYQLPMYAAEKDYIVENSLEKTTYDKKEHEFSLALECVVLKNLGIFYDLEPTNTLKELLLAYTDALLYKGNLVVLEEKLYKHLGKYMRKYKHITPGLLTLLFLRLLKLHKKYQVTCFIYKEKLYSYKKRKYYCHKDGEKKAISPMDFRKKSLMATDLTIEKYVLLKSPSLWTCILAHPILSIVIIGILTFFGYRTWYRGIPYIEGYDINEEGMRNLGNTCYFNSMIQAYTHHNSFNIHKAYFNAKLNKATKEEIFFLEKLWNLARQVKVRCVNVQQIIDLLNAFTQIQSSLIFDGTQQDSQEWLNAMVDCVNKFSGTAKYLTSFRGKKDVQFSWKNIMASKEEVKRIDDNIIKEVSITPASSAPINMPILNFRASRPQKEAITLEDLYKENYSPNIEENKAGKDDPNVTTKLSLQAYLEKKEKANFSIDLDNLNLSFTSMTDRKKRERKLQELNDYLAIAILLKQYNEISRFCNYELPEKYQSYSLKEWLDLPALSEDVIEEEKEIRTYNTETKKDKVNPHEINLLHSGIYGEFRRLCRYVKSRKSTTTINYLDLHSLTYYAEQLAKVSNNDLPNEFRAYNAKQWMERSEWKKVKGKIEQYYQNKNKDSNTYLLFKKLDASHTKFKNNIIIKNILKDTIVQKKATQLLNELMSNDIDITTAKKLIEEGHVFYNDKHPYIPTIAYNYNRTPEQIHISEYAQKLILFLGRFRFNQTTYLTEKVKNPVTDILEFRDMQGHRWYLDSMTIHQGSSVSYGHYVALVRKGPLNWEYCSDNSISPRSYRTLKEQDDAFKEICEDPNAHPYVLFYSKAKSLDEYYSKNFKDQKLPPIYDAVDELTRTDRKQLPFIYKNYTQQQWIEAIRSSSWKKDREAIEQYNDNKVNKTNTYTILEKIKDLAE